MWKGINERMREGGIFGTKRDINGNPWITISTYNKTK
jgi:hypothetical protein